MKNAVGYIRVSTGHQKQYGASLRAQEIAIREYAEAGGYRLLEVYCDSQTAVGPDSLEQRIGLNTALSVARHQEAVIIVLDLTRLSRDIASLERLMRQKFPTVISIKDGENLSPIAIKAKVAKAEVDAEHISRRTHLGMEKARSKGVRFGNPLNLPEAGAKGSRSNRNAAEHFVHKMTPIIQSYRLNGQKTLKELADMLNSNGFRTRQNKRYNKQNIRTLVNRVDEKLSYKGLVTA